jgi:hypothetical protein
MTAHDFYVRCAVECALAAEEIPTDRTVLLHMAATYVRIASDIETRQADRWRAPFHGHRVHGRQVCRSGPLQDLIKPS